MSMPSLCIEGLCPFISFNVGQVQPAGHSMSHKNQMWTPGGRTEVSSGGFLI